MKLFVINIILLVLLILPSILLAVETAPRISDREIIEKLATLEAGQKAIDLRLTDLRSEMKSGQAALRSEMKSGQEALGQRLSDSNNTMLALFGALITLIVTLFAYIAWDRRTMIKPVIEQLHKLEHDINLDLDLHHVGGSLLTRQLKALRAYAKTNPEFAEIMRGLALL